MDGSLSDPPIIYTQQRFWLAILCAVMAWADYELAPVATNLLFAVIKKQPATFGLLATIAIVLLVLFALVAMIAAIAVFAFLRMLSPATLSLSPDGITYTAGGKIRQYDWRQVTNIRVDNGWRGSQWVAFDYLNADQPSDWLSRLTRTMGGPSVGLGGNWDAGSGEIADTIIEARKRWYKAPD